MIKYSCHFRYTKCAFK